MIWRGNRVRQDDGSSVGGEKGKLGLIAKEKGFRRGREVDGVRPGQSGNTLGDVTLEANAFDQEASHTLLK